MKFKTRIILNFRYGIKIATDARFRLITYRNLNVEISK